MLELRDMVQEVLDNVGLNDLHVSKDSSKNLTIVGDCGKPLATIHSIQVPNRLSIKSRQLIVKYFNKWINTHKDDLITLYKAMKDFDTEYKSKITRPPATIALKLSSGNSIVVQDIEYLFNVEKEAAAIEVYFAGDFDKVFALQFNTRGKHITLADIEEVVTRKQEIQDICESYRPYFEYRQKYVGIKLMQQALSNCKLV
jgi:hypothetical protein